MNYLLRTLLQRFGSCKYPKSKMAAVWCPRWRPKWPPFSYFDHNFLTIHTRNTSKVSKHMFWGIRNLPEALLRCFDFCKYPKIQDGSQNGGHFYILIVISQSYMLETQVRYPNICFKVWTIYLEHYYNVLALASTQNPKWPLFGVQDGVQNGRHFRILIITSLPYTLETQVRYPNICFEV